MHDDEPRPSERDLTDWLRRAHRYWYEDGVPEVFTGLLLVALSAYFGVRGTLSDGATGELVSGVLLLGITAYVLFMRRLMMAVKRRWTLPRRDPNVRRQAPALPNWLSVAAGAGLAAAIVWGAAALATRPEVPPATWAPLFGGLLLGVALYYLGHRLCIARFFVLALLSGSWGALVARSALSGGYAAALYLGGMGALVVASGVLQSVAYVRRTGPPSSTGGS